MKRFFLIIFILLFSLSFSYSENINLNKYKALLNICKSINDKGCELKYYSQMYELSDKTEKEKILKNVKIILKHLTLPQFTKINFNNFKRNYIYLITKLVKYRFINERSVIEDVLNEANALNLYNEIVTYIKNEYNINLPKRNYSRNNNENINILLLLPLTGKYKNIGEKCLQGALTGIDFFNNKSNPIKIFPVDSSVKNDLKKILDASIDENNINIIIGPLRNSIETEVVETAIKHNIPIISLVENSKIEYNYKYYFRHNLNINDEIKQLGEFIRTKSYNLSVLYPDSSFGNRLKYCFLKNGFDNALFINYSPETVDFREQIFLLGNLQKKRKEGDYEYIQQNKIDSVFIADDIEKALLIIPQLHFYDLKHLIIYGTNLWNSPKLLTLDQKFQENIYFADLIDYNSKSDLFIKYKQYLKYYFDTSPCFYNILLYDTLQIILRSDFRNNESLREFILNNKFFLLTGDTYFDNNGISHKKFKIFTISNGKIISY